MSSFVYNTDVKFVFKEASEQLLQDNMSDSVHLGEFYACFVFFLFFSSRTLLEPPQTLPLSPVQGCNVNIKEIYLVFFFFFFFLANVVDNQSQAWSSPSGERQPWRLEDKLNSLSFFFCFVLFVCFLVYWKSKLGGLFIHMFVAALKFTQKHTCTHTPRTHFSTTLKTQTPRAFGPSAFYFQGEDANLVEMML